MKSLLVHIIVLTVFCSVLNSCKKDTDGGNNNNCLSFMQSPVTEVSGPKTGNVNRDINFTVSFTGNSGCARYGICTETASGNTRTITVTTRYEGCVCTMYIPTLQTTYTFKASQAGTYYLKFLQRDNNYLTDTLVIQ